LPSRAVFAGIGAQPFTWAAFLQQARGHHRQPPAADISIALPADSCTAGRARG